MPTDQRVRQFGARDPGLVALHAQYGRYLLIASSRPGNQPPNLQGIWNDELAPPWSSNWTININTEMKCGRLRRPTWRNATSHSST